MVGHIVLPTGQAKDLLALVDCGSTNSFIKLNLVKELRLEILSLGVDTTTQAAGKTRPLTMTLGPSCSHKARCPAIKLGDHNITISSLADPS